MQSKSETLSSFKKIVSEAKSLCRPTMLEVGGLGGQGGEEAEFL